MSIHQLDKFLKPWKPTPGQPLRYFVYDQWKPRDFAAAHVGSICVGAAWLDNWQWFITEKGEVNIRPSFTMMSVENTPPESRSAGLIPPPSKRTTSGPSVGTYGYLFDITEEDGEALDREHLPEHVKINVTVNVTIGQNMYNAQILHVPAMTYFDCKNTREGNLKIKDVEHFEAVRQYWCHGAMLAHNSGFPQRYLKLAKEVLDGCQLPREPFRIFRKNLTSLDMSMPINDMVQERDALDPRRRQADARGLRRLQLFGDMATRQDSHNGHNIYPPGHRGTNGQSLQAQQLRTESSSSSDESGTGMIQIRPSRHVVGPEFNPQRLAPKDVRCMDGQQRYSSDKEMVLDDSRLHYEELDLPRVPAVSDIMKAYHTSDNLPSPPILPSNAHAPHNGRNLPGAVLPSQGDFTTNVKVPPIALMSTGQSRDNTSLRSSSSGRQPPLNTASAPKRSGSSQSTREGVTRRRPSMIGNDSSRPAASNTVSRTTFKSGTSLPRDSSNKDADSRRSSKFSANHPQLKNKGDSGSWKRSADDDNIDAASEHMSKRGKSSIIKVKLPPLNKQGSSRAPSTHQSKASETTATNVRPKNRSSGGSVGSRPRGHSTSKNNARDRVPSNQERQQLTPTAALPARPVTKTQRQEKQLESGVTLHRRKASMKSFNMGDKEKD